MFASCFDMRLYTLKREFPPTFFPNTSIYIFIYAFAVASTAVMCAMCTRECIHYKRMNEMKEWLLKDDVCVSSYVIWYKPLAVCKCV